MRMNAPSFERNHAPIWAAIGPKVAAATPARVLELACGSGQHAITFAPQVPQVIWQPTDGSEEAVASTNAWRETVDAENLMPALLFDMRSETPPAPLVAHSYGGAFVCNFLHMVPLDVVEQAFAHLAALLAPSAPIWVYDCFTYGGEHVSESNVRFDAWLKERGGAVHAFEEVDARAKTHGFDWTSREDLPANNQMTIWTKRS